jgi:hypothetical protein
MPDRETKPDPEIQPGIYRHYKGNLYQVISSVRHSETREVLTLYRALYGAHGLWVRPSAMFSETVIVDGTPVSRFVQIEAESSASSTNRAHTLEASAISPDQ